MTTVERYVPSVEAALHLYAEVEEEGRFYLRHEDAMRSTRAWALVSLDIEAASVALDMANALASEERIRASVAW